MWQTVVSLIFMLAVPAVIVSMVISVIGILKDKYWLIVIGAVLFLPFSHYLNGAPALRGFAILLPLFQMGSAAAVREHNKLWAWLLLVPSFLAGLWALSTALFYQLAWNL